MNRSDKRRNGIPQAERSKKMLPGFAVLTQSVQDSSNANLTGTTISDRDRAVAF